VQQYVITVVRTICFVVSLPPYRLFVAEVANVEDALVTSLSTLRRMLEHHLLEHRLVRSHCSGSTEPRTTGLGGRSTTTPTLGGCDGSSDLAHGDLD
jgi:hypothetical protein